MATNPRKLSLPLPKKSRSSRPFASQKTISLQNSQATASPKPFYSTLPTPENSAARAQPPTGISPAPPRSRTASCSLGASPPKTLLKPSLPFALTPLTSPAASNPIPAKKIPANSAPSFPKSPAPTPSCQNKFRSVTPDRAPSLFRFRVAPASSRPICTSPPSSPYSHLPHPAVQ